VKPIRAPGPGLGQLGEMSNTAPSRGRHHHTPACTCTRSQPDSLSLTGSNPCLDHTIRPTRSPSNYSRLCHLLPILLHDPSLSLSLEEYIATIGEESFLDNLTNDLPASILHNTATSITPLPNTSPSLKDQILSRWRPPRYRIISSSSSPSHLLTPNTLTPHRYLQCLIITTSSPQRPNRLPRVTRMPSIVPPTKALPPRPQVTPLKQRTKL